MGPEQEYFLIDRKIYDLREDLKLCGRTLFGAKPPKGQELDDHYYGAIKPRVAAFMRELDEELWKLGVLAKTEHNEVAPAQHEIAPIFSDANTACDKNQLTMELLKKVAARHGLVCLLHEKPFAGINGSGKHDNWSLQTDTGENLLKPGGTPSQNAQFLLFLAAFVKGVDEYQEMLRCCVSYPGNDHRLGGNEAPPAIISIFLGDELTAILDSIVQGTEYVDITKKKLKVGVDAMPEIPQDTTDRNRTSPLAFTGNKFEFRMLGSSQSIASPNVVLNTIMAAYIDRKNVDLFTKHAVLTETEMRARYEIHLENYCKVSAIEANTLLEMAMRGILPAVARYTGDLAKGMAHKQEADLAGFCRIEDYLIRQLSFQGGQLLDVCQSLTKALEDAPAADSGIDAARYYRDEVGTRTQKAGELISQLESLVDAKAWPYPTYADILFSV